MQNSIYNVSRVATYAKLTVGWSRVEVPVGCYAELPPVFTYMGSAFMDPCMGFRVFGYTEMVAKEVAFVLLNTYGNYRIWQLSGRMIKFMQNLSMMSVIGSDRNIGKVESILNHIS